MKVSYLPGKNQVVLSDSIEKGDREKIQKAFLKAKRGFSVKLNSPGGNLLEALDIGDLIKKFGVDVYVEKMASSAAVFLLIYGRGRYAEEDSTFLFHLPRDEKTGKEIHGLTQSMAEIIHAYTFMSISDAISLMKKGYRMDIDDAIKYGLIHKKVKV